MFIEAGKTEGEKGGRWEGGKTLFLTHYALFFIPASTRSVRAVVGFRFASPPAVFPTPSDLCF